MAGWRTMPRMKYISTLWRATEAGKQSPKRHCTRVCDQSLSFSGRTYANGLGGGATRISGARRRASPPSCLCGGRGTVLLRVGLQPGINTLFHLSNGLLGNCGRSSSIRFSWEAESSSFLYRFCELPEFESSINPVKHYQVLFTYSGH